MLTLGAGTTFGKRYRILKSLGAGAAGAVYLACDIDHAEFIVALKILYPGVLSRPHALKRFRQEIIASYTINHLNIVRAYEFFDEPEYQAYAMEYVDGGDLAKRIAGGSLTQLQIIKFMKQIASGLGAIHEKGIIHRDLKPANILLTTDDTVKISDFGVARLAGGATLTDTGVAVGTPRYLAPEYLQTGDCDLRGDIYALGIIGYEMAAGVSPFESDSSIQLFLERLRRPPKALSSAAPDLDRRLVAIIEKCMTVNLGARYQSTAEVLKDLTALENNLVDPNATQLYWPGPDQIATINSTQDFSTYFNQSDNITAPSGINVPRVMGSGASQQDSSLAHEVISRRSFFAIMALLLLCFSAAALVFLGGGTDISISDPLKMPGLAAQLDAADIRADEDGKVMTWKNLKFPEILASQTQYMNQPKLIPGAINGRPALEFDGKNDFLEMDSVAPRLRTGSGLTLGFVARVGNTSTQWLFATYGGNRSVDVARVGFSEQGRPWIFQNTLKDKPFYAEIPRINQRITNFAVYSYIVSPESVKLNVDGKEFIKLKFDGIANLSQITNVSIGQDWDGANPSDFFAGQLAEILIYNRALNSHEVAAMEKYLTRKFFY